MFRKPFFGQINRQMMQKVVDFQQPAYHITKSIPFWSVLEEACPYTGRSKRVLPIIRWVQEHAGKLSLFLSVEPGGGNALSLASPVEQVDWLASVLNQRTSFQYYCIRGGKGHLKLFGSLRHRAGQHPWRCNLQTGGQLLCKIHHT